MKLKSLIALSALALAAPAFAQDTPAPAADRIDPSRQRAADKAVAALVPEGVYARMMRDMFPQMMDAMTEQMLGMKASDIDPAAGGDATMAEELRAKDPAFAERMKIMTQVMSGEFAVIFGALEPRVRAGLGRAFARKFTVAQLEDMNLFFATPSGKAFADEYLLLFADPEMMREMSAATPEIMRAMPAIMKKIEKATAHLPPPPKPQGSEE